jgi:hypothetical protein
LFFDEETDWDENGREKNDYYKKTMPQWLSF